jgi:hypothetical protein
MAILLNIWRTVIVATGLSLLWIEPLAFIFFLFWGVVLTMGYFAYIDCRRGPGFGKLRKSYENAAFVWNWRFPDYRPWDDD